MTLSTAALALPRSAGAVTRTLSVSPSHPAMPFRDDAGTTLIGNLMVVSASSGSIASCACYASGTSTISTGVPGLPFRIRNPCKKQRHAAHGISYFDMCCLNHEMIFSSLSALFSVSP